ncbi:alpha/beta fold hydrolase [Mycolicibacterium baixiangningiae]|uniref:alpha/beta fold hydrolase n=1 Tax=Mycolicibacterium baixiangningiae TaxID=2761578 RepID=UPI00384F89D2
MPDQLAFGQSSGLPQGRTSPSRHARCVRFLTPVELDRFHLVGHDWGGPIGPAAAARRRLYW